MTSPATLPPLHINPLCLKPEFFPNLLDDIANGALLIDVCSKAGIKYSDAMGYILTDSARTTAWNAAVKDGQSWMVNRLISELAAISQVDVKDAFNSDGTIRPIEDMPNALRRAIAGIEVAEIWEDQGLGKGKVQVGVLKKIKMNDKLKSIEMLGKQLKMFVDEVVVSGTVKHEHSVSKFDLDERLAQIRAGRPAPAAVQPIQDAEVVSVSGTPGEDI